MSNYLLLKNVHMFLSVVAFSIYVLKGVWMTGMYPPPTERWVRAIFWIATLGWALTGFWLTTRFVWNYLDAVWVHDVHVGIIVFIAFSLIAYRYGPTQPVRVAAWIASLVVYMQVVATAVLQTPYGLLALPGVLSSYLAGG